VNDRRAKLRRQFPQGKQRSSIERPLPAKLVHGNPSAPKRVGCRRRSTQNGHAHEKLIARQVTGE
jgi:hypothetical protein